MKEKRNKLVSSIAAITGLGIQRTNVIGADLEGLILSQNKANLSALLMLEETNFASSPPLPFRRHTVKTENLWPPAFREKNLDYGCVDKGRNAHYEDDILIFLM
jgi:hypothetical protein